MAEIAAVHVDADLRIAPIEGASSLCVMTGDHDKRRRPRGVSEPVQVYLTPSQQARLNRLTAQLALSKSEIIRRGLEALEQQLTDPASHPALQLIGLLDDVRVGSREIDVARDHDRYLADSEVSSWSGGPGEGGAAGERKKLEGGSPAVPRGDVPGDGSGQPSDG